MFLKTKADQSEGSNSSDIVDAWVYSNGLLVGLFELPTTVPILAAGTTEITILPGIKKNGLNNTRITYPFYTAYEKSVDLIPGVVDTLAIEVEYRDITQFVWLEDFEDGSVSLEKSGSFTSVDSIIVTMDSAEVFEFDGLQNTATGKIELDTGFQIFENSSLQLYDLPRSGQEIYLEFDFKSDREFVVGIYPVSGTVLSGVPIVNFFSTVDETNTAQWKKAYVSLKEDVNDPNFAGLKFKVFFYMQGNSATEKSTLFLDNIKLIHF
jgi:hypothetical protein